MRPILMLLGLAVTACGGERNDEAPSPAPAVTETAIPADNRQSQPPKVIPMPKDQAQLDRMILAGYTPHADHLHPPGVKSCPLAQGGEAVM